MKKRFIVWKGGRNRVLGWFLGLAIGRITIAFCTPSARPGINWVNSDMVIVLPFMAIKWRYT
jgi:hypothetical protein